MSEHTIHPHSEHNHLAYCEKCGRFFDTRSGCEADVRFDERARLRKKVEAMQHSAATSPLVAGINCGLQEVLALLAEPAEGGS